MNRKCVYVDFDGTIVDVMKRYHGVLAEYLAKVGVENGLEYSEYIYLKRAGYKDHEIVKKCCGSEIQIPEYVLYKREQLEKKRWLRLDTLIGEPMKAYNQLKAKGYDIRLLTQRNSESNLLEEIEWLQIVHAFDEIIVVKPQKGNAKLEYLKRVINREDILVGDGPLEMECTKLLDVKGYFVQTGLYGECPIGTGICGYNTYNAVAQYINSL